MPVSVMVALSDSVTVAALVVVAVTVVVTGSAGALTKQEQALRTWLTLPEAALRCLGRGVEAAWRFSFGGGEKG